MRSSPRRSRAGAQLFDRRSARDVAWLKFEVAELSNLRLGEANGNHIRVDNNAGGNGWFIDANAQSDALFAVAGALTRAGQQTNPRSAIAATAAFTPIGERACRTH